MTDPIADMLTPSAQRQLGVPRRGRRCPTARSSRHIAEILQQEGYIASWKVEDAEVGKTLILDAQVRPATASARSPACAGSPSRACACTPSRTGLPKRPRRPRRRDHLDVNGSADRQAGGQEGRGWGSPRLRLVTGGGSADMSRIGSMPIPVPAGVDVDIDGSAGDCEGPEGHLSPTPSSNRSTVTRGGRQLCASRGQTTSGATGHCHGLTRTLVANMVTGVTDGYREDPGDPGRRLPRPSKGSDTGVLARLTAIRSVSRHRRASPSRSRRPPGSASRASTSRWSARSPRTSASSASPTRTRARACATHGEVVRRKVGKAGK